MSDRSNTNSGVSSYDRASWSDWIPELSRVHSSDGLESLYQHVPRSAGGDSLTDVPSTTSACLIFWTQGQTVEGGFNGPRQKIVNSPWQATIIPPNCSSTWVSSPASADGAFHLHVSEALLGRVAEEDGRSLVIPNNFRIDDPLIAETSRWMFAELGGEQAPSRLMWSTAGIILAARLSGGGKPRDARRRGGLTPWQQRRATEYLADHLSDAVALTELARTAGLSTFHFARMFKQSTGLPPHAYQRRLRCEKAKQLLTSTPFSVGMIAAEVGYETPQAFARMFRAEVGASPSDYRRERTS